MRLSQFLSAPAVLVAAMLAGCASAGPDIATIARAADPDKAHVTVQHKFRLLGGASGQTHDLFDVGTGLSYNASVPEDGQSHSHLVAKRETIGLELFAELVGSTEPQMLNIMGRARAGASLPSEVSGIRNPAITEDSFDVSLIGRPLLAKIDIHRGGATTNARPYLGGADSLETIFLFDARGELRRVKIRALYDAHEDVLYRSIAATDRPCLNSSTVYNWAEVSDFFAVNSTRWLAFRDRATDFLYGEICGLVASFPVEWNARYVGSFPGYDDWTWQRDPGMMKLFGVIGYQRTYADEINVEAGQSYTGTYDPNKRAFLIRTGK